MNSRIMHPPLETAPIIKNRQEKRAYVTLNEITDQLSAVTGHIIVMDAMKIASEAGNPRTENVVLLGAVSKLPGFPVKAEALLNAVKRNVPTSALEANIKAFHLGAKTKI